MKKLIAILLLLSVTAWASQNPTTLPTTSPYPGLTMLNNINSAFDTFQTNFSGSSPPSSPKTWQWWMDTTNSLVKIYDGTEWQIVGSISGTGFTPVSNGSPITAASSTGSSNAYVVAYSPEPTALVVNNFYPFVASFQNTGPATLTIGSISAHPITKQGAVALASHDISNGMAVQTVWDGTEFQIIGTLANTASGTVTSVGTSSGICGGSITTSGSVSLCSVANNTLLANTSGSSSAPVSTTLTAFLDAVFGTTQGSILYRGSSAWAALGPGSVGQSLISGGASANPAWGGATGSIKNVKRVIITTSGTWTPDTGLISALIECQGGGGGRSSSAAFAGGGGGYANVLSTASTIGSSQSITIGSGGGPGFNGGTTSVGSLCSANGGSQGGPAGCGVTGDFKSCGTDGGQVSGATNVGGGSYFGGGSYSGGGNYGGGSGNSSVPGGANGVVVITEYLNQ